MLDAFEAPVDTFSFGGVLRTKGVRTLVDIPFLKPADASVVPENITPTAVENNKPEQFKLEQNYPNPFNPTTHFAFRIAERGLVTLKVYDLLGREMATIVNEELQPGTYNMTWNASSMPSGVYFYRLQAGIFTDMKKMILMK